MSADFQNLDPEVFLGQFAEAVRRSRDQLDISQEELAARAGLHRTYISDVECGNRNLTMRTLCRLAAALNQTPSRLMKLAEAKRSPDEQQAESDTAIAFFNQAPCGFHSVGANGLILRMNDTELDWLGYSRHEVVGKMTIDAIIAPECKDEFDSHFDILNAVGRVGPLRSVFVGKHGRRINVLISSSVLRDDGGKYLMNLTTVMDTSQLPFEP